MMIKISSLVLALALLTPSMAQTYTKADVANHKTSTDCWTIIGGTVYDLSAFTPNHNTQILQLCGKDGKLMLSILCMLCSFSSTYSSHHARHVNAGTSTFDNVPTLPHPRAKLTTTSGVTNKGAVKPDAAPSPSPGGCFSSDTTVQLESGQSLEMRHLKVGNKVKVEDGKFEAIYAFAKRTELLTTDYLKIGWKVHRQGGGFLELTPNHMLLVSSAGGQGWKMIPADKVKIGDEVVVDGPSDKTVAKIVSISSITKEGAYAPLTFSGKLVANGIQASAYVSYQNKENLMLGSGTTVAVTWQWLAQTFLLPIRWMGSSLAAPLKVDMFFWLPSFFLAIEKALVSITIFSLFRQKE